MLNPRSYLEDCIRFGLHDLWATGMPWAAVNSCIDTSFNYSPPEAAVANFATKSGHSWKNTDDSMTKQLYCPRCLQSLDIPWTTTLQSEKASHKECVSSPYRQTKAKLL